MAYLWLGRNAGPENGGRLRVRPRRRLRRAALVGMALLALAVPVALAARPAQILPQQRVDARVLLVTADGTQPTFSAWKAALDREGVPYKVLQLFTGQTRTDTQVIGTPDRDFFADYKNQHAFYNAVILESGDLSHCVDVAPGSCAAVPQTPAGQTPPATSSLSAFSDAEWAALAKFEKTFGIRQISDNTFPAPVHGLTPVGTSGTQDGAVGTLTDAGKAAFPYLKGEVPIANDDATVSETFGVAGAPVNAATWTPLVAAPGGGAWLGVYTHPDDSRQEMVMTVSSNEFQSHSQLLRHGMLTWVTRGVYLGFQRNYLELQVDDLFLPDDAWDPNANVTGGAVPPSRMTPTDVAQAVAWSKAHGIRIDFAYNGGGSELFKTDNNVTADPLADAFQNPATRSAFGWINHTYEHPNIDCSTASFITKQISDNVAWGRARGLALDPTEVVTGEHSGLANSRPGNPGSIDAPSIDVQADAGLGPAVPAGTYEYALTAASTAGESTPATETNVAVTAGDGVRVTFNPVCHATTYRLYRRPTGGTTWSLAGTQTRDPNAATDDGTAPLNLTITDVGGAGSGGAPPLTNAAALAPYGQNPNYLAGVTAAGIRYVATDASKTYPTVPTTITSPQFPAGATFSEGSGAASFQTFPRWPTNVYYNTSTQGQQLDEYNWIYLAPANGGGCVPIAGVTTCRTTPATWADYVTSENNIMFRHLMGNDPRPHFMHQSNLADWNPTLPETALNQGGILYAVVGPLLARYERYIDRASTPLVQLTSTQITQTLAQQATWASTAGTWGDSSNSNPQVEAWLQDGQLHVKNDTGAAMDVPLTGTTAGDLYGGQRSGWTSVPAGGERVFTPADPANTGAPSVSGTVRVGQTLTAHQGAWTGTPPIGFDYQWQRCDAGACTNIPDARDATYKITGDDEKFALRVVVLGGNWISSVTQAASSPTRRVPDASASGRSGGRGGSASGRVTLTRLTMHPRRFAVSHRRKRRGTRLDGSIVTWRLNTPARVRMSVQRRGGSKGHRRWVTVTRSTRTAKAGRGVAHFTGRYGKRGRRLLSPRRYRLVVFATKGKQHSRHKHVVFRVVKG